MNENISYVGLDVHKAFIQVALICVDCDLHEWRTPNTPSKVKALIKKVCKLGGARVEICYEAGPTGYGLARKLNEQDGFRCQVIAPSLIPKKAGDRVKTDRRDAKKLATYLKAGLLTEVQPPSPEDEARRELTRARSAAKQVEKKAKQRLSKFTLRQDRVFRGTKKSWTNAHMTWLDRQKFDNPHLQTVFDSFLLALSQATTRVRELDEAIEQAAQDEAVREQVELLKCFKGIQTTAAMGYVTELYAIERFRSPAHLMSFVGLTASEHSTGGNPNRGGITKAGNGRVRKLLVESAWAYSRSNKSGYRVRKRREDQPAWAIDIAERAQHRLHKRYWRLVNAGKHPNKAITAIARELVGFIGAMLMTHRFKLEERAA